MHTKFPTQLADTQWSISLPFTGKEKDSESGYYYFGARYFMPTLSIWNSVDPMADKYPSLSPYNYCAWNPMKIVDPNGEEIDVSELSTSMQQRLIKCLGKITGLNLEVKNGVIVSNGERNDGSPYSKSARKDILEAIGDDRKINVYNSEDYNLTGDYGDFITGEIWLSNDLHAGNESYDDKTEGLGMGFLHELGHAFFGDNDPGRNYDINSFSWLWGHSEKPYPNSELELGDAVKRVNGYRKELGMAIRVSYESYNFQDGDLKGWKKYDDMVAFEKGGNLIYLKMK